MKTKMRLTVLGMAGLALVPVTAREATAQPIAPTSTHDGPTSTHDGVIAQVLVNPHGDPDGLWLRDGTIVRFPPHAVLSPDRLRVGAQVQAEGEALQTGSGLNLFEARISSGGSVLVDPTLSPPPPRKPPLPAGPDSDLGALSATGRVRLLLTNPDGVADGFVLEDGTTVHAGPHGRLQRTGVAPGATVSVTGIGGTYPQGRSLRAQTLQIGSGPVYDMDRRPPPPAPPTP